MFKKRHYKYKHFKYKHYHYKYKHFKYKHCKRKEVHLHRMLGGKITLSCLCCVLKVRKCISFFLLNYS